MTEIKTRSRLYIDCPYCKGKRKGKIGSIYEVSEDEKNSVFIKFERCPKCHRITEARLGFLRNGKVRYTAEVRPKRDRKRAKPSKTVRKGGGRDK